MALLRRGKLLLNYWSINKLHKLVFMQQFINKSKLIYTVNSTFQKRIFSCIKTDELINNLTIKSNVNKSKKKYNSSVTDCSELYGLLEQLGIEYHDMRVDYKKLLNTIKIYVSMLDNNNARFNDDDDVHSISLFLLNCCGNVMPDVSKDNRRKLTAHFWKAIQDNNIKLTIEHYHTLLNICAENNQKIDYNHFLKQMPITPNELTYINLLNIAAKTGDLECANFILSRMKEFNDFSNPIVVEKLIELFTTRNDIDTIYSIIKSTVSSGFQLNDSIYGYLACIYALKGDTDNLRKMLSNYNIGNKHLFQIIVNLIQSNSSDFIDNGNIFEYFDTKDTHFQQMFVNTIIEVVQLDKLNEAMRLIQLIVNNDKVGNVEKILFQFLKTLVIFKIPHEEIFEITSQFNHLITNEQIYLKLLEEALYTSYFDLSIVLLDKMKKESMEVRTHYFWPLFIEASKTKGELGIFEVIKRMNELNIKMDFDTLFDYILPYINTSEPLQTYQKLKDHGVKTQSVPLICYFLEKGEINNSILILKKVKRQINFDRIIISLIKAYDITNDAENCVKILKYSNKDKDYPGLFLIELIKSNNFSKLNDVVSKLSSNNIKISKNAERIIINNISSEEKVEEISNLLNNSSIVDDNTKEFDLEMMLTGFKHPNDMNEDELECHLIELKSKGLNTRGVLRKLFIKLCHSNNLQRVEQIKNDYLKLDKSLTLAMKSSLFYLYAINGHLDESYIIICDLQTNNPEFKIDSDKIIHTATIFIQNDKLQMAFKIIQNNGKAKFQVPHKCWELLDAIANSQSNDSIDSFLELLLKNSYCQMNSIIFGPLIRRHILKNDLKSAYDTFNFAVKNYKKTPFHQELVIQLVENLKTNKQIQLLLKNVYNSISAIHGKMTADLDLIFAYAHLNMRQDLEIALQNLIVINVPWKESTAAMPNDRKLKVLNSIFDVSQSIPKINRNPICEALLSVYYQTGDCDGAIELWRKMKDEDVKPSKLFRNDFFNLLNANKVQIPIDIRDNINNENTLNCDK